MNPNQIHIWRIAANFDEALQTILERAAGRPIEIVRQAHGKPYIQNAPELKFNFSRTRGRALVAVALDVEIGVDIERLRPLPEALAIAERFLPPLDAEALAALPDTGRQPEFFRRWTRAEAVWKAAGLGLYAAGRALEGEWMIEDIDAGEGYAAAVAAARPGLAIHVTDFGAGQ